MVHDGLHASPHEIEQELVDAGWVPAAVVAVEGIGVFANPSYWLDDSERQAVLLRAIRRVEAEPSMLGSSPHLIAVAAKPG